jgi:acetyl/propionyl-CoA carboxylase alpha subunit
MLRERARCGIVWIGPPAEAIAAMGKQDRGANLAVANGVPVVPGTTEPLQDAKEAEKIVKKFGYPVLLKAAAGGGGKGMRVVSSRRSYPRRLDAARREAKAAFGDDAVYLRNSWRVPRHVEIQIPPTHTATCSLGERRMLGTQRRHSE